MRLNRHNGRANKNGAYSTSHNDRNFDITKTKTAPKVKGDDAR